MNLHYDRLGVPIDLWEWARLMEDDEYRVIALDVVGEVHVSTVWLGLDHSFGLGPPLIFETMVFENEVHEGEMFGMRYPYREALDELTMRYPTEAQARDGHAEVVTRLRELEEALGTSNP